SHSHGHIDHVEFVDGFHAQVFKAHHLGVLDGFGDKVSCAAHSHQVSAFVLLDGFDGNRAALGLTDHGDQASLGQHHLGELVHAGSGGGACWANSFVTHGVHRTDVVNHAVGEIHRQIYTLGQHVLTALVGSVAAGQNVAVEQQGVAGFPAGYFLFGQRVQVDFFGLVVVRRPVNLGPCVQRWWVQIHGAAAVHHKVGMAGG